VCCDVMRSEPGIRRGPATEAQIVPFLHCQSQPAITQHNYRFNHVFVSSWRIRLGEENTQTIKLPWFSQAEYLQ